MLSQIHTRARTYTMKEICIAALGLNTHNEPDESAANPDFSSIVTESLSKVQGPHCSKLAHVSKQNKKYFRIRKCNRNRFFLQCNSNEYLQKRRLISPEDGLEMYNALHEGWGGHTLGWSSTLRNTVKAPPSHCATDSGCHMTEDRAAQRTLA